MRKLRFAAVVEDERNCSAMSQWRRQCGHRAVVLRGGHRLCVQHADIYEAQHPDTDLPVSRAEFDALRADVDALLAIHTDKLKRAPASTDPSNPYGGTQT